MAHPNDYTDALDDIAQKAFSGEYGDAPFDRTTPGGEALFSDAYERIGAHNPEIWFDGAEVGSVVVEAIHARYDIHAVNNYVDNPATAAFDIAAREQAAVAYAPQPKTMDDVIREADDKQQQVDLLASRNEAKIESGKPITTLSPDTMEMLKSNGIDVSALEKQFGTSSENNSGVDNKELESVSPAEKVEAAAGKDTVSEGEAALTHSKIEKEGATEANNMNDASGSGVEVEEKLSVEDLVFKDEDGNEVSFKDILADLCENDEEIKAILKEAVEISDRGEDPRPFMENAIADYAAKHSAGADVESDSNDGADKEGQSGSGGDSSTNDAADNTEAKSTYETKFEQHSEKIDERKALPVQLRGDTFTAYHEMAKVYNAHKGGIEINGKVPTKLDVAVSVLNFTRTNILETLVIELVRSMITKKEDDKDNVEIPEQDKVAPPTDKYGIEENGNIEKSVSPEEAKEIGNYRSMLPQAGKMFGADMTKVDRGSTPDVTIRSTNPDGINGRGVTVTLDDAKKYTIPDVRLVEMKGERLLVDPFGKILDVITSGDKYKVGQVLGGLDISSRGMGKEAIETYARDLGLSVDQAKEEVSHVVKERFCERVESSYKMEASAIEKMVLPREHDIKADLQSKLANLENIEKGVATPDEKAEIGQMKADVSKAIETIDGRIEALRSRQTDLEQSGAKPSARSTNDRFSDAVSSEKRAVGRSVFTTELGIDRNKIQERVSTGVEAIKARVEAHNATVPEKDQISYDSKTGDFVDRFGISDKGEYVGNANGKFMDDAVSGPATKEEEAKYIEDHMDPSRFTDTDKILAGAEVEKVQPEIERPEGSDVEQTEGTNVEQAEGTNVEQAEGADVEQAEGTNVEQAEGTNVEQAEGADVEQTEGTNVEQTEGADVEQAEETNAEQAEGSTEVEAEEGNKIEAAEDEDGEYVEAEEESDITAEEVSEGEDVESEEGDDSEATEAIEVLETEETNGAGATEACGDDAAESAKVNVNTDNGAELAELAGEDDDLDEVEAAENNNGASSGDEDAKVQNVQASDAVEGRASATGENEDKDPAEATDGNVEAVTGEEDDDKNSWLDDLKESLSDYIEGCAKQLTDPIGYEADKLDRDIDQICDLIELLGGDASGLREAAHELVSSAVDAITNAGDPTAQEAMKEAFSHLFKELGFKLEDPGEFFNPLISECNDAIGTDREGLVDDLTDAYRDGANDAEDAFYADTDFESVHLDDNTVVTQDGIVDEIGQTTGGVTDENAHEIEGEINDATAESVPQEVERLDPDATEFATIEDIAADPNAIEEIAAPDTEIIDTELLDVDMAETGVAAVEGAEEVGTIAEGAEGAEVLIALL